MGPPWYKPTKFETYKPLQLHAASDISPLEYTLFLGKNESFICL